jgi:hypothetical protein
MKSRHTIKGTIVSKRYTRSKGNKGNKSRKTMNKKFGGAQARPKYAVEDWAPKLSQMKKVAELLDEQNYSLEQYDADLRIIEENIVYHSEKTGAKDYVGREACSGGCNFTNTALDLNEGPGYGGPGRFALRKLAEYVIVSLIEDVKKGRAEGSLLNPK